jgi:hypothetical protein
MRIRIDECVNPRVRHAFSGHTVVTVTESPWRTLPDHNLVIAAQGQVDVLVTLDKGFEFEHNLKKLTFGIVIVHVARNRIEYYRPLSPELVAAVENVRPGRIIHVGIPLLPLPVSE